MSVTKKYKLNLPIWVDANKKCVDDAISCVLNECYSYGLKLVSMEREDGVTYLGWKAKGIPPVEDKSMRNNAVPIYYILDLVKEDIETYKEFMFLKRVSMYSKTKNVWNEDLEWRGLVEEEKERKKGKYPGQPDWMPACEMMFRARDGYVVFVTPIVGIGGVRLETMDGMNFGAIHPYDLEELYTPIYELEPRPLDPCVTWDNRSLVVVVNVYKEILKLGWSNVLIIKTDSPAMEETSNGVETWLEHERAGHCERLK